MKPPSNLQPPSLRGDTFKKFHHLAESVLVDGETNKIFWQGSSPQLQVPLLEEKGIRHIKATILTSLLLLALLSVIVSNLRGKLRSITFSSANQSNLLKKAGVVIALASIRTWGVLLSLHPKLDNWTFVGLVCFAYVLEAYGCSTRRYLKNSIDSEAELTNFLGSLRREKPRVEWKVRCFHYERRGGVWGNVYWGAWSMLTYLKQSFGKVGSESADVSLNSSSSLGVMKVVTNVARKEYDFPSWTDNTIATTWKRSSSTSQLVSPFTKVRLSKTLVLRDAKTREDYFAQQAAFVTEEGRKDEHAEFSTTIQVKGFKSKILVVRTDSTPSSSKIASKPTTNITQARHHHYLFWIFTLVGLTVPFRIWFSRHCDEVCVTITKESSWEMEKKKDVNGTKKVMTWSSLWGMNGDGGNGDTGDHLSSMREKNWKQILRQMSHYQEEEKSEAVQEEDNPQNTHSVGNLLVAVKENMLIESQDVETNQTRSDDTTDNLSSTREEIDIDIADASSNETNQTQLLINDVMHDNNTNETNTLENK